MLRDTLFRGADPYSNYPIDPSKVDLQGWGSDHPILPWAIQKLRPSLIIEVGSWKGRSAINMAKAAQAANLSSEIVCVDTWLGSPEHWLQDNDVCYPSLRVVHGRPTIFDTFMNNVISQGCEKYITPLSLTSEAAYFVFKQLQVKSQLIYIDAGHEYESVTRDIRMYWNLLSDDGLMILDDYIGWHGVTEAVNEFAAEKGLQPYGENGKAVLPKNPHLRFSTKLLFE